MDRPEWLTEKTATKILWNGYSYELHLTKVIEKKSLDQAKNTAKVDLG
ncbi:MAG: hypothetical protein ISN64_01150 [Rickettsia sp.]|nr:hypothetical protein [Rickettsia sp.]